MSTTPAEFNERFPQLAEYARNTDRVIPVIGLECR